MSRLQTGALDIAAAPVGLDEVVPRALASLGAPDRRRRRRRRRDAAARRSPTAALLERALANVIANAIALLAAGDAAVGRRPASSTGRSTSGSSTGARASRPTSASRLFEPFQRLGDAATERGRRPRARGREGLRRGDGRRARGRRHPGRRASRSSSRPAGRPTMTRILVVDDEPQILRALATNLRARGYDVDLAGDGRGGARRSPRGSTPTS